MSRIEPASTLPSMLWAYEHAVYEGRIATATPLLVELLTGLDAHRSPDGLLPPNSPPEARLAFHTRIAAAISTHVRAPGFVLDEAAFHKLCRRKPVLAAVFAQSGFGDGSHLAQYLGEAGEGGALAVPQAAVPFLCLFFSLDNIPQALFTGALGLPPGLLLPLMLGWLNDRLVMTAEGEARRAALLQSHERITGVDVPAELHDALAGAWMFCSYASVPDKHAAKRSFNRLWLRLAEKENVRPRSVARQLRERPRLLVAAEYMRGNHAMYRCYAPGIAQLRERFHTILLSTRRDQDEAGAALFDEAQGFDHQQDGLRGIVASVIRHQPDLIYFPSIGMASWAQVLANLRLAPLQFMTLGHPATSMAAQIDYVLINAVLRDAGESLTETVIVRAGNGCHAPHPDLPAELPPLQPAADGRFHIAINSSGMKLSYRLLDVCRRLQAEADRPVHFEFFSSCLGIDLDNLRYRLGSLLSGVTVHPMLSYPDFLAALARCELALAAFPFGNTNSTIDTSLLGIPTVAYVAPEPSSQGDKLVMHQLGLPAWLLATTDEAYFQTALRLIRHDTERTALSALLRAPDMRNRLFSTPADEDASEFVDAVWWMYNNHEAIKASGRHCLAVGEI